MKYLIGLLPDGLDPDEYISRYPDAFKQFCESIPLGTIVSLFDGDKAGRKASLRVIEQFTNAEYDDGYGRYNKNWVIHMDEYKVFLEEIVGVCGTHYRIKDQNWANLYTWPSPRLEYALIKYHEIIEKALFFGNSYMLEWVLPVAKAYRARIEDELEKRATPRKEKLPAGLEMRGWLDAKTAREKMDCLKVYGALVADLKPVNKKIARGTCPIHGGRGARRGGTPSFTVYLADGGFKCFGCQAKGSAFDFIMQMEGLDFAHAVNRVGELSGIPNE